MLILKRQIEAVDAMRDRLLDRVYGAESVELAEQLTNAASLLVARRSDLVYGPYRKVY